MLAKTKDKYSFI